MSDNNNKDNISNKDNTNVNKPSNSLTKDINIKDILKYLQKGLSYRQISDIVECSPQLVHKIFKKACPDKSLKEYRDNKDSVLEELQADILYSVEDTDIKGSSMKDRIVSMGILEDKIRLIRGESTQNVNINQQIKDIDKVDAEITRLEEELQLLKAEVGDNDDTSQV